MSALVYKPTRGEWRWMTYEEMVAQCAFPPDKNTWGQQCRSDPRVNHDLFNVSADVLPLLLRLPVLYDEEWWQEHKAKIIRGVIGSHDAQCSGVIYYISTIKLRKYGRPHVVFTQDRTLAACPQDVKTKISSPLPLHLAASLWSNMSRWVTPPPTSRRSWDHLSYNVVLQKHVVTPLKVSQHETQVWTLVRHVLLLLSRLRVLRHK